MIQILEQFPVKKKRGILQAMENLADGTVSCAFSIYYSHITSAYILFLIFCQKTLGTASF